MNKIVIGTIILTVLVVIGGAFYLGGNSSKTAIEKTQGAKIEVPETSYNFNDIKYSGGNVKHEFIIKNIGDKDLQIANIATSCMCSKAFFQSKTGTSPEFGMKGMSQSSDWKGILKPGEIGKMVAVFDPAFHGPQGIGPISRIVSFETNDPDHPYIEVSFAGVVVK